MNVPAGPNLSFLAQAGPAALDAVVKSVLLLAAAALVTGAMRRGSAAARHLVWLLAVAGLFALPALSWMLPGWNILPRWMSVKPAAAAALERPAAAARNQGQGVAWAGGSDGGYGNNGTYRTDWTDRTYPTDRPGRPAPSGAQAVNTLSSGSAGSVARDAGGGGGGTLAARFGGGELWLAAWLAGFALVFLRTAVGVAGLWRLERGSRLETALSWLDLLRRLASGLGLRRRVALLKSHRRRMPMTWGVMRPRLLLPEVSEAWPEERRRVVLLHELAHAWRWDYATNLVTRLACAVWWFDPLVWLAARQMAAERERACDDIVLNQGAKPAEYAEQLLEIAAGLRPGGWTECAGIAMARPTKLEGRLRAILDANRNRAALTRAAVFFALLVLTAILIPVAMMKAAPGPQRANPQSAARLSDSTARLSSPKSELVEGSPKSIRNPQSLSGRVLDDATGEPIVNFVVQRCMSNSANPERALWGPISSGSQRRLGLFDGIPSPLPQQSLRISAPGYVPEPLTLQLMTNAPASGLEIRLKRGGEIHGVVLNDAGWPVAGAQVFLTTLQALYLSQGRQFGNIYNGSSTTTDGAGRFVLRAMGGTVQRVAVVSPDGLMIWPAVQSRPGEDLKVALPKPGTLILGYDNPGDDAQAKLNLAFMTLTNGPEEKSFWINLWFSRSLTVANGGETILTNITPGTYDISRSKTTANGNSAIIDRQSVVIEPGQTRRLDVAGTNGQRIRGQVVGLDQVKATGGSLSVRSAEATGQPWPEGSRNYVKEAAHPTFDLLQFGADGTFQTAALKPGTYTVIASVFPPQDKTDGWPPFLRKPDYVGVAKITVTADAMSPVSIKLAPALFVDIPGQVVDDETGAPVRMVMIQTGTVNPEKPGEISWSAGLQETGQGAPAGGPGQFSLRDVKAGTALRFLANGYLPQTILRDEGIAATQTNGLLVRLKRGGELHGVVHDYAGAPVAAAKVILAPVEFGQSLLATISMPNSGAEAFTSTATTDATGRFSLRGAGDRPRVLVFTFDSRMVQAAQPAAPGRELNITLPAPATLIVRYDIPGDAPWTGVDLSLGTNGLEMPLWKDFTSHLWEAVTNGTQIVVSNLAPGTYDFSRVRLDMATNSDGFFMFGEPATGVISDNRKVVLESGRTQQVNIVRSVGQRVQGQVTGLGSITNLDQAFLYVASGSAIFTPSDFKTNMFQPCFDAVDLGKDGHFQTALLEPGNYTLAVEVYVKGEPPEPEPVPDDEPVYGGFFPFAMPRLAYVANTKVTVTTNALPPPVKIELHPWVDPAKAPLNSDR